MRISDSLPGIDVKEFGAKGDGVTDDTAAFNQALASGQLINVFPNRLSDGTYPQTPYMVSQIVMQNGSQLQGNGSYLKQIAGTDEDMVVLSSPTDCFITLKDFYIDGNYSGGNASGRGVAIIGDITSGDNMRPKNPANANDPYYNISNLVIFNTADDGFYIGSDTASSIRGGGSVIENIKTFYTRGRGAYFNIYDAHILNIDCGDAGLEAVIFDIGCGSLHVSNVKGWYPGQVDPTRGNAVIISAGSSEFVNIEAQAAIPGNGIVLKSCYLSSITNAQVYGAGSQAGFGSTPSQFVLDNCSSIILKGIAHSGGVAPVGNLNLITFVGANTRYDIDILYVIPSVPYTALVAGVTQFPVQGGGIVNSLKLNNTQQLGQAFAPIFPAAQNPTSGWIIYCDSGDGNKLKARYSTGTIVTLATP